jgi:hypothetical protein
MLHAGLDLSRKRLDYCLLDEQGNRLEESAAPPDGDGLRGFARGSMSVTAGWPCARRSSR